MSFWKLTKALAAAPTDGINGVLAPLKALDDHVDPPVRSPSLSPSTSSEPDWLSPDDLAAHYRALDTLLAEPDLLSEIKSGSNPRLTDFLARKEIVLRLGGWVVWGLGRGFVDPHDAADDEGGAAAGRGFDSGLLPDEMEQGKVPDEVLSAGERERKGMGGVPRRRDVTAEGKFAEGDPVEETDSERKWAKCVCRPLLFQLPVVAPAADARPRAAQLSSYLDRDPRIELAKPHRQPVSPRLGVEQAAHLPFSRFVPPPLLVRPSHAPTPYRTSTDPHSARRESILGSTELQLASRAQQVGFWARVNSVLLDGPMGQEVRRSYPRRSSTSLQLS